MTAVTVRWFGGPGQSPGICELPLETLVEATCLLRERCAERVSILGISKSAEAALLVSTLSDCADAVIALAPSSVVWANVGPGHDGRDHPYRSSWTWQGQPLPFVPYLESRLPPEPSDAPVALLDLYECSLKAYEDRLDAAAIPIEQATADLVFIAGGADRMWPSLRFARELADRRTASGREAMVITQNDAGHRIIFPNEATPPPSN
ncbi:acyl-CoA thioester hydrolase/BAAT C-terminal domain-containing protein [Streptomyces sp. NPDC056519]|uniref:acyl-CoA thioester hydrolase/BAAT C-terminal domain-containing protein n=1 Tax=Streptomyces sp. NPDC056519 TaxID=3345849 RepID=UPI0036780596